MSKNKNDGLDQYSAGPFEQQQFGTAGIERVKSFKCEESVRQVNVTAAEVSSLVDGFKIYSNARKRNTSFLTLGMRLSFNFVDV